MDIKGDGFLSEDMEPVIQWYRAKYADAFRMVIELSRLAQAQLPSIGGPPRTVRSLFASAYFIRAVQTCQGAVVMAERGMFTEAYTMLRGGIETLFYLGASIVEKDLGEGRDHVQRTKTAAYHHMKRIKEIKPDSDTSHLESVIDTMMEQGTEPSALQIKAVAAKAKLDWMHETLYQQLSVAHAHPTPNSLKLILEFDADQNPIGIGWGPVRGDTGEFVEVLKLNYMVLNRILREWFEFRPNPLGEQRLAEIDAEYDLFIKSKAEKANHATPTS